MSKRGRERERERGREGGRERGRERDTGRSVWGQLEPPGLIPEWRTGDK